MITTRDADDRLMTADQVFELTTFAPSTLARWRLTGEGPKWQRIGRRAVRYWRSDVLAWIEQEQNR